MRAFEYKKSVGGKSFVNDHACNCIGPQDGQPLCPCAMRDVKIKNGRYVIPERDLGPAPKGTPDDR